MSRQPLLWCRACGREGKLKKGLCLACYSKERRSHAYFGGLRWRVLARDRSACRVYRRPGSGKRIHVHHRRPGVTQERFLITLCPGHHAMIHCLEMVDRLLRALVLELWREQHPEASEQLALDFNRWDSGTFTFATAGRFRVERACPNSCGIDFT